MAAFVSRYDMRLPLSLRLKCQTVTSECLVGMSKVENPFNNVFPWKVVA